MAQHHPSEPSLVFHGSDGSPVGHGNVLYPAQIRDVVDVAEFVDIGSVFILFSMRFTGVMAA
jgi:hypothetical protein